MKKASILLLASVLAVAMAGAAPAQTRQYEVTVRPSGPQSGFQKVAVSKAALGSTPIQVWANTAINPDCSARVPGSTLRILQEPAHGSANVSDAPDYFAFPPNNPRAACNSQKVPGHQAFYTASQGYKGRDRIVLEGSSPEGGVRQITVNIEVR